MNYYIVINANSTKFNEIKDKINELMGHDELQIYSIKSSPNTEDIKNSVLQNNKPLICPEDWNCIANGQIGDTLLTVDTTSPLA